MIVIPSEKYCSTLLRIDPNDILFTDWLASSERSDPDVFKFFGVEEIKKRIGSYLTKYKVYEKREQQELKECLECKWDD